MNSPVLLRRAGYRPMPWRNGAGITHEIAREPADGGYFSWRLSLATVASSGPFSDFSGFQRSVTLVQGKGLQLAIGAQPPVLLATPGASVLFAGDASTCCTLIDGACSDLSLMVREPGAILSVAAIRGPAARRVPLPAGALSALFCLGAAAVRAHPAPSGSGAQLPELELALHDTVLLGASMSAVSIQAHCGAPADLLLLSWTVAPQSLRHTQPSP